MTTTKQIKVDRKNLGARVASAAGAAPSIHDRLKNAGETLAVLPTGHSAAALPAGQSVTASRQSSTAEHAVTYDAQGRKIYFARIDIDLVDQNPFNARDIYIPEKISEIAASIATSGQLVPGMGTMRDGRCVMVAGHYRYKAISKVGLGVMDFMIHEGLTDHELYEMSFVENDKRNEQTPLDNALVWRRLIRDGLYPNDTAIAEATGQSASNVSRTMSILSLSQPILDMVKEKPEAYGLSVLNELHLLEEAAGQKIALGMAAKIGEGLAGRKDCIELRTRYESPKQRKRKESSRQYKIHDQGQVVGTLKDWDSGKVAFEIMLPDPKARADLVTELKKRFKLPD